MDPIESYIRSAAAQRGIDPDQAVRVAGSEGLNTYTGDNGSSFGPFQLHYGNVAPGGNAVSGLGDEFTKQTGLDARDPSTVKQQIDFSLDHAAQNGWGPWHGWKGDPWAGIGNSTGQTMPDNTTPMQPQQQQPTLFGGNPTPIGLLGGLSRMLGIGSEDALGNRLKNAGASLMSVGNFGQDGPRGAAMMQEAANQPHFNVVTDALGNRFMVDTRTGQVVNPTGAGVNGQGAPSATTQQQNPNGLTGALAQSPVALATRAKAEQEASQEKMKALEEGAAAAQGAIDQNTQAMKLSQSAGTLQGPGLWTKIRDKVADATGGTFGGVDIAQQHELDKLNQNLVSTMLSTQKGIRFAAPEIKFGQSASADLEKPATTNQQIYSNNIQIAQRAIAARDLARQHMATYGVLGPEYSKQLQAQQEANPIYQGDAVKPTPPAGTSGPPLSSFWTNKP